MNNTQFEQFEVRNQAIVDEIHDELEIYASALYGGRGLFDASNEVDRGEWNQYVKSLDLSKRYPGMQGFGFAKHLLPEELEEHISSIKSE